MGAEAETQSQPVVYFGGFNLNSKKRVWYRMDVDVESSKLEEGEAGGYVLRKCNNKGEAGGYVLRKCNNKRRKTKIPTQPLMRGRSLYRWFFVKAPDKTPDKKMHRVKLYPAAELKDSCFSGGCSIVDQDLYWFGPSRLTGAYAMLLAKHPIKEAGTDDDPLSWEILYSSPCISSNTSAVVPVGRKLYVLCGIDTEFDLCGAVYDLDRKTWENLKSNIYTRGLNDYYAPHIVAENKTEILFYSLLKGSVVFFDISSCKLVREEVHSSLVLWNGHVRTCPQGLDLLSFGFQDLITATHIGPACLTNNTLYWFTNALRLYGYDVKLQKWFHSPSLWKQFPTLSLDGPLVPSLVVLPNGKLLVIVFEGRGEVTVAPLKVSRKETYLKVTVESFHAFSLGDTSIFPLPTMSTVKG